MISQCHLKELPGAIEDAIYVKEKWPVIIDTTGQAGRFLKYQRGSYLLAQNPADMSKENLRARLVGNLRHGGNMTIVFESLKGVDLDQYFDDNFFPSAVLDRGLIFKEETWGRLLRQDQGDPEAGSFLPRDDFVLILLINKDHELPPEVSTQLAVVWVLSAEELGGEKPKEGQQDEELAGVFGAKEIKRNAPQLVEAAFDGELEEVKKWLDKGFHIESADGRGHTAVSEAAAQGQDEVLRLLLDESADPNALNDNGRSALWRACYNGHAGAVSILLGVGGDPAFRDKASE
ncbi:unnamed protein product, partial [Discosporangium mesarthrocarpum]